MKIGILTLHYIPNYGAVLQSYALLKVLERYEDVEIIDYRQDDREVNFSIKTYVKKIPDNGILYLAKFPFRLIRNRYHIGFRSVLQSFYRNELKLKKKIVKERLLEAGQNYSAIVIGSDQVWNPNVLGNDYSLLLDFFAGRKYAYAPSIAMSELPIEKEKMYKHYLQSFRMISCREQEGVSIINKMFDCDKARLVLDPTMLLDANEWKQIAERYRKSGPYFFVYMAKMDTALLDLADQISELYGIKMVLVATPSVRYRIKKRKCLYKISPQQWVGLLANAELVLTNSFHGIAFSINLSKPFFAFYDTALDVHGTNSRLNNILQVFGLQNRKVETIEEVTASVVIDYHRIQCKLSDLRAESLRYIEQMIKDIEEI